MRFKIPLIVALLLGLLIWLAFFWQPTGSETAPTYRSGSAHPTVARPAGGDFTLNSPDGKLSLHDYRGKVVLIYFGYTFCPDVCPTSLAAMAEAFSMLSPEELARVRGLLVSVDPERDTQEVLKVYAPFFHPAIVGVTGTPAEVAEVARRYGVSYAKQKAEDGRPYAVDHSAFTYLVGPDGTLKDILPHDTSAKEIAARIRQAIDTAPTLPEKP